MAFALPEARAATLELFDVAGRRVWSRDVGSLGAGEHVVPLRDGPRSAPGLYLVRLRQGDKTGGRADLAEARKLDSGIDAAMVKLGVKP